VHFQLAIINVVVTARAVQMIFVLATTIGEWVYLTTLEIALIEFAHLNWHGLTRPTKPDNFTNILNVLVEGSVTGQLLSVFVLMGMRGKGVRG